MGSRSNDAASSTAAQVSDAVGLVATPLSSELVHPNAHLRAGAMFVKVFSGRREYFEAEVAVAAARPTDLRTPRLVSSGSLADGRPWTGYEWVELQPAAVNPVLAEDAGRQLGLLHAQSRRVPGLRERSPDLAPAVETLCGRIATFDAPLAERIQRLAEAVSSTLLKEPTRAVLLHGDWGWRNALRGPDGAIWLIDFEHARWGHPFLDFAKPWDRELAEPTIREAFMNGYSQTTEGSVPSTASMGMVRLWAAAGIFPYARRLGDVAFAEHGRDILDRLEADLLLR